MLMIFILVMKDMTYTCSLFSEFSSISAVTGDAMLLFGIYHRYINFIRENFIRRNTQVSGLSTSELLDFDSCVEYLFLSAMKFYKKQNINGVIDAHSR